MTRRRGEAGLTSTELAVLMPVVIALVLVPFQVGLWWHAKQVADGAARHGVDVAQVEDATAADGEAAAHRFLESAGNLVDPVVSVSRSVEVVTVEVVGRAQRLLPGFDWQVTARASAPVERFVPEPDR